jgi:hypothetical protein
METALKQQVRVAGMSLSVPVELREGLITRARPSPEVSPAKTSWWRGDYWLRVPRLRLAVAGAALLIFIAPVIYLRWPAQSVSLSALETHRQILAGKVVFLQTQSAAELQTQMVKAVGARFAPMGYDLSMMKLRPANGTVQALGDRKILVMVYRGDGPEITCFTFLGTEKDAPSGAEVLFDRDKNMNFYSFSRAGISAVLHREGEVICILVSKMPAAELLAMARAKARHA